LEWFGGGKVVLSYMLCGFLTFSSHHSDARRLLIKLQGKDLAAIVTKPENLLSRTVGQFPRPRVAHREDKQLPRAQAFEFCRTIIVGAFIQRLSPSHNSLLLADLADGLHPLRRKIPALALLLRM
jgi:hypothetical protein